MQRKRISTIKEQREELTIKDCFYKFMTHCKVKNLSERTLKFYREIFLYFTRFYNEDNLIESINIETVEQFILHEQDRGLTTNSVNTNLRGLRVFFYFCMERKYLSEPFKIHLLKAEEVIKECYTDAELKKILRMPYKNDWLEWRNWAIVNFLIGTGARVSTVISIKIEDLRFDNDTILFKKTKNRKQQVIPVSPYLKKALLKYLSTWDYKQEDFLFPNQDYKQLTANGFIQCVSAYNRSRGVTKTSSHLFRHTFATNYIKSNGNLFKLQKLLGHSSIDIVKKYVNLLDADLQEDFARCNALDRLYS
jgi:integrase/recombinase XerD